MQFIVYKKENDTYYLRNVKNETFKVELNFIGVDVKLDVKDFILLNSKLLDKNFVEYSEVYYFGGLDEPYGRKITEMDIDKNPELLAIYKNNKYVYLKRFYG